VTGELRHLARRFWATLGPGRLGPADQAEVAALLRREEAPLFWRQSAADQRHTLACARAVLGAAAGRRDLARAALLHDVGKAAADLGVAGRTLATLLSLLHVPVRGRPAAYLAHASRGADDLRAAGAEPLTVLYARHHHGTRPPEIAPHDWELLARADRA